MMKVRVYRTVSGDVVVDTPSKKYQEAGVESCPHPWRFRDGNPDKESFELEIMDYDELSSMSKNNEAGAAQFYYKSGKLKHDDDWSELLMPKSTILKKYKARIEYKLETELFSETTDPVVVLRLHRMREKLKKMPDVEVYQQALKNLDEDGHEKPKIRRKLADRIRDLGGDV